MDQAPPLGAIGRFFLSAPLFLVLGGFVLAGSPLSLFQVFAGAKLAAMLHLLTLGFLSMVMMGALLQMLPVIAGVRVKAVVAFARVVHTAYIAGVLTFPWALYQGKTEFLGAALLLLVCAIVVYIVIVLSRLLTIRKPDPNIRAMQLSLVSFLVVAGLGSMMGASRLGMGALFSEPAPMMLHYAWAAGGWVMILIAGVSYRVIPMFYVAQDYPRWLQRFFAPSVFLTLVLYSLSGFLPEGWRRPGQMALLVALHGAALLFAAVTLQRIRSRKRKLPDSTLRFWWLAGASVGLGVLLWFVSLFFPHWIPAKLPIFWGFFILAGGAAGLVMGMSYKIVPFLSWFHLASRGIFTAPTIKSFISDFQIKLQFGLHLAALSSTFVAILFPGVMLVVAGTLWSASGLVMFFAFARSFALNRKLTQEAAEKNLSSV